MATAGFVALASAAALVAIIAGGVHTVPEGYMGVYWMGGALSSHTTDPGWRWVFPGIYTKGTRVSVVLASPH